MHYDILQNGVLLWDIDSFSISQTLECGQCFRFLKIAEEHYMLIAKGKILKVQKIRDGFYFYPTTLLEFETVWIDYFDLKRDYAAIKETLAGTDEIMKEAVAYAPGIRILHQDFFECLISFIISQNNKIPRIKQIIENISRHYGDLFPYEGMDYYSFPSPRQLKNADSVTLAELKTGFRNAYILDAVAKINTREILYDEIKYKSATEMKKQLMKIKGVGDKVSDCVVLFSLQKTDVFPTDVWIKRVMEHFYFNGEQTKIEDIHKLASEKFNALSGFAQQYLFHYARQKETGKC